MNVIYWFLCQDSSDHATTSSYAPSKTEQEARMVRSGAATRHCDVRSCHNVHSDNAVR